MCSQNTVGSIKIKSEVKSSDSFWMYLPLSTSLLVAIHDDIEKLFIQTDVDDVIRSRF